MLTVTNLSLQFADRIIFDHINLVIKNRDRIGLVGRNGAGKSTFLKVIAEELLPDEGTITKPGDATLAFLHQDLVIDGSKTVIEEALSAFDELNALHDDLEKMNQEIAQRTDYESESYMNLLERFSDLNDRLAVMGEQSVEGEASKVLKGLGFKDNDMNRLISEFSGGWQMRVILAKMLLQRPDYLLLDEPTNHLDIESIIWLENFLSNYHGAIIIISHDQQFLDNCTNRTVEIELGRMQDYRAPYSKYLELRKDVREKQQAAFENQQKMIAQKERTINRFKAKATKTKMAQSMQKQLDKIERIEIQTEDIAAMNIRFPPAPRSGQIVVETNHLQKKYGDLEVLSNIDFKLERGERVAFVGQNGQGKTTLAKILVGKLEHTGGTCQIGHNVSIGYYAQNQAETLDRKLTLLETMEKHSPPEMRTQLRKMLGAFMFSGEDVDKKVSVLSGGERARLALACMLLNPFNLLVLDEPTNHLDMISKDVLKEALRQFDGTLIVVSHDRHFLAGLTEKTFEFRDRQIFEYLGDVNYFLQKRKVETMRDVEMHKTVVKDTPAQPNPKKKLSNDEQQNWERKLQNTERKIDRLEKEIKQMELKMGEAGFYESEEAETLTQKYKETQQQLENQMEIWEACQMALEA